MSDAVEPKPSKSIEACAAQTSSVNIARILSIVVPVALLGGGAFLFFGYFDGAAWLLNVIKPPLVQAGGTVEYQGNPLAGAQIVTRPLRGKLKESLGWTDDEGRFSLKTDIDGNYVDGAYAGEHQVLVTAYQPINAPGAPPLLTPQAYSSYETTPLKIQVTRIPEQNQFVLKLEGNPPARKSGGGGKGKGQRKGKKSAESVTSEEPGKGKDAANAEESVRSADAPKSVEPAASETRADKR